jgi:hypothetical protein
MKKHFIYAHRGHHSIRLVVTLFVLLGFLVQNVTGSVYMSLLMQSYTTVTSPPVILESGTAGTSTIYTNSTSAKVSVSGYGYDYVDNNNSDVDLSADKGTHSNFTAQKYGPDLINDTLTEENTFSSSDSMWLYVNADDESKAYWTRVGTNPYLDAIDYNTNYIHSSLKDQLEGDFGFTDSGKSTETINSVTVQIYVQQSLSKDLRVFVWDSSSWTDLGMQTLTTSWRWENYTATAVLDTWAKIDGAEIYLETTTSAGIYEVDCARLQVDYSFYTPPNYELDLEVHWTSVDFDETYGELCIKTGTFSGSEDIMVYAWNVSTSDWHFLYNLTASNWNNVSVMDWLNNENFTARFLGGNESSDTNQDSWNIDATLLHVWTVSTYDYDYVLRVNNIDTDSWQIRLKKYADSTISRLENCTVYFHNSTNEVSGQIYIENGAYTQDVGPWYNLSSLTTIYIAMTAEANSTATSYVSTYLEILTPSTTTYSQYIITFEIT